MSCITEILSLNKKTQSFLNIFYNEQMIGVLCLILGENDVRYGAMERVVQSTEPL
jgi:hypothetical protein